MEEALCVVCHMSAKVHCYCTNPPTVLCSTCYPSHVQLKPGNLHLSSPYEEQVLAKRVSDVEMCFCGNSTQKSCRFCRFSIENKRRKIADSPSSEDLTYASNKLIEELQKNLSKLIQVRSCLASTRENIFASLEKVFASALEKIKNLEDVIRQLSEEIFQAQQTSSIDESIYAHWLIKDLINSRRIGNSDFCMFDWEVNEFPVIEALDQLCKIRVHSLPSPSLCYFKPDSNFCLSYNVNSSVVSKNTISLSEQFRPGAVWCQIADQKYFYCGGERRGISNQAYFIYSNEGTVHVMPSMNTTRAYHGIIYFERNVYVFGGVSSGGRVKSCEKYDFERSQWMFLPSMLEARSHFTPCASASKIFIVGGCGSSLVECFDPVEISFTKLPFSLPFQNYWTLSAHCNNDIIVFQGNTVFTIHLITGLTSKFLLEVSGGWWSETPVYSIKDTFLFFRKKSVFAFDYKFNTIKEKALLN